MKKPEYTKPFDLEHARAGAPYGCRDGTEATVLKWDRRDEYAVLGICGDADRAISWTINGEHAKRIPNSESDLVMLPLGFIDGKPVWTCDEIVSPAGSQMAAWPAFRDFDNCTWPAPAPVYPETLISHAALFCEYETSLRNRGYAEVSADSHGLAAIANFALRHAIDAGQVVLPNGDGMERELVRAQEAATETRKMLARDADRDLAVAWAVSRATIAAAVKIVNEARIPVSAGYLERSFVLDLPAIIAGVAK